MKKEYFKIIIDFDDYLIGDCGTVISLKFNKWKVLKPKKQKNGYLRVTLCKNGGQFDKLVHRLVAETFLPNPDNLPEVNHKNEIKTDNRVENLEWCDAKYNSNYGTIKQKISKANKGLLLGEKHFMFGKNLPQETKQKISKANKRPVVQIKDGQVIKIYDAVTDVEKDGFIYHCVSRCCHGKFKHHHGFQWILLSDYEKMFGQLN